MPFGALPGRGHLAKTALPSASEPQTWLALADRFPITRSAYAGSQRLRMRNTGRHGDIHSLTNWTEQGLKDVKATVDRLDAGLELASKYGVTPTSMYWTVGNYDMVFIAKADDDESISAYLLDVCSRGAIRSMTMRAYDREGMRGVLDRLN